MGRIGRLLGSIPLVPTKRSLSRRLVGRLLSRERGEADFLGLVRDEGGWHRVPCDYETDGDAELAVPLDGSEPYPADGVGGDPGTLFGVPVVTGFRNFGCVRQLPATKVARDVVVYDSEGTDPDTDGVEPGEGPESVEESAGDEDAGESLPPANRREAVAPLVALAGLAIAAYLGYTGAWLWAAVFGAPSVVLGGIWLAERNAVGAEYLLEKAFDWQVGDADALALVQDTDGQWALERVDYNLEDQLYESRDSGYVFDAESTGAQPATLAGAPVGLANGRFPVFMSPLLARIGRNVREERLAGDPTPVETESGEVRIETRVETMGGGIYDADGRAIATDGGVPQNVPEPIESTPEYNDIEVRERAFVSPDDVKLIGLDETTQEKLSAMLERVKASQNAPGGELRDQMVKYGGYVMMLILGWWMGQQAGGGGGGGGVSSPLSTMDAAPMLADAGAWLANAAAVGVV